MERRRLTDFDIYPEAMTIYMRYYGPHFNKKLCQFAISKMEKEDEKGNTKPLSPYTKENVEALMRAHNVKIKNN